MIQSSPKHKETYEAHGQTMGEPWARRHDGRQLKTQETLPTAGFPIERMTRFELATLTLARLWSPSVQSV